jgi:hypothetical protein
MGRSPGLHTSRKQKNRKQTSKPRAVSPQIIYRYTFLLKQMSVSVLCFFMSYPLQKTDIRRQESMVWPM